MVDKHFMIYCVNYGQSFDDEKFFETYDDAVKCMEADRVKHKLTEEDKLIGIKTVKVWKQYKPKRYGHNESEKTS